MHPSVEAHTNQKSGEIPEDFDSLMDADPIYAGRVMGAVMLIAFLTGMSLCLILTPPLILLRWFALI